MKELIQTILDEQKMQEDLRGAAMSAALAGAMLLNPMTADASTIHKPKHHAVDVQKEPQVPIEVRMLVGEAENQGLDGMRAVASAFRNLSKLIGRKNALSVAYGAKRKFKKMPPAWVWKQAEKAWSDSAKTDYAKGANHWGTDSDVEKWRTEDWFPNAKFMGKIGDHNLYKEVVPR